MKTIWLWIEDRAVIIKLIVRGIRRGVWLFLAMCLLATGVEAGDILIADDPPSHLNLSKQQLAELARVMKEDYGAELHVKMIDDPCLAKMEAAMRAMDTVINGFAQYAKEVKEHGHGDDKILDDLDTKTATRLWEAAKKECWREP